MMPYSTTAERTSSRAQRIGNKRRFISGLALAALAFGVPAGATQVEAGTRISNTAVVGYTQQGKTTSASASTSFLVDQLLDVAVTWQDSSPVLAPAGAIDRSLLFKVTNTGNGADVYRLKLSALPATGEDFAVATCRLYLDSDHNGIWTDADTPYVPGSNDPGLAAGASTDVLALCNIPGDAVDRHFAKVQLAATSTTFTGKPGDARPSSDIDGLDLVLGLTGNSASDKGIYQAGNVGYTFDSRQKITDVNGGNVPQSGSTIEYTLIVKSNGSATGRDLIVTDPMPEHTTYVPGTLVLDNSPLGDSDSDGDAGNFNITAANAITVNLGDMPGNAPPHYIVFQVTIN